jgi:hypothetical protein
MNTPAHTGPGWQEDALRLIARMVATSPAGQGLLLIGGFRYRLLDGSARTSLDLDYHWSGDLAEKQRALHEFCVRRVLPEVRRTFSVECDARMGSAPGEASAFVKVVELALWKPGTAGRVEIPIDVTRIPYLDKPVARAIDGTLFLTASDADMAESKVLALLLRTFPAPRDVLDIFLFENRLPAGAPARLRKKISSLKLRDADIRRRIAKLRDGRDVLVAGVDRVVREQVEPGTARTLRAGGGAKHVVDTVLDKVDRLLARAGDKSR